MVGVCLELNDLLGVGKAIGECKDSILKLLEVSSKAIGKLYEPTYIKRKGKAEAEAIRNIASAINENNILPISYSKDGIEMDSKSADDLLSRMKNRLQYQEMLRQSNIEKVIQLTACDLLQHEEKVSDAPVNKDWATRYFNNVADVSDEDVQSLWSKILSGEIKKPGSFSLRTLELLRNISKEEAQEIIKISDYIFYDNDNNYLICWDDEILEKGGISFSSLLLLQEAGILNLQQVDWGFDIKDLKEEKIIYGNKIISIKGMHPIVEGGKLSRVVIPAYNLTRCGVELYSITRVNSHFKEEYFNSIQKKFEDQKLYIEILSK